MSTAEQWLQAAKSYLETHPDKAKRILTKIVSQFPSSHEAYVAQFQLRRMDDESLEIAEGGTGSSQAESEAGGSGVISRIWGYSFAVSIGLLVLVQLIVGSIPGCSIDEGGGARGCSFLDPFLNVAAVIGFFGTAASVFLIPILGIAYLFARSSERNNRSQN